MKRTVIQLIPCPHTEQDLYALCSDGTMWSYGDWNTGGRGWIRIPHRIPDVTEDEQIARNREAQRTEILSSGGGE